MKRRDGRFKRAMAVDGPKSAPVLVLVEAREAWRQDPEAPTSHQTLSKTISSFYQ